MHHPVTVRRSGFGLRLIYLVAGLHRLEAAKQLGWQTIPCEFLQGGETVARLWEISENLDRAELTSLERDRLIAKWVRLTEAENSESGEKVKKKARGRPEGGIAKAARQLPVKGETEEAKRKTVERALKSDRLLPGAEDAAKAAGFDKNRSLIIKIGAEKTLEAQLARIAELAGAQRNAKARAKAQRESGSGNKVTFDSLKTEWLEDKKLRRSAWEKTAKGDCVRFAKEVLRVSGEDEEGDH